MQRHLLVPVVVRARQPSGARLVERIAHVVRTGVAAALDGERHLARRTELAPEGRAE